jgi:hypothetical protein
MTERSCGARAEGYKELFMKLNSIFIGFLIGASGFAALPPFAQSLKEIEQIIKHADIYTKLGVGSPLESITLAEDNDQRTYVIKTANCTLNANVVYLPLEPGIVGPAKFRIDLGTPACQR